LHEEIGTKSSKDAPLQSLGIDDISKSLIDLAKKNSMLDSSPINSKSIDLFRSIHELRPCMKSLNNGEVMQEHRQQARVVGKLDAWESFWNLKRWELLRIFWS